MTRLVLVLLAVVGALGAPQAPLAAAPVCEGEKTYAPCTCKAANNALNLLCNEDTLTDGNLKTIFGKITTKTFGSLTISKSSSGFTTIPNKVFGDATFTSVELKSLSNLATIEKGAFDGSKGTLKTISITGCAKLDPTALLSEGLDGFKLDGVTLTGLKPGAATLVPITAKITKALTISDFALKAQLPKDFAKATGAKTVTLSNLGLTELPATAFSVANDSTIDLGVNALTTDKIDNTTLVFADKAATFTLKLHNNSIAQLNSSRFEPIFKNMLPIKKKYEFYIKNNPLECGCDMSWIFCNDNYTSILTAQDGATCTEKSNKTFSKLNICDFGDCKLDDECTKKFKATECSGAVRTSATSLVVAAVLAFLIKM